MKWLSLKVSLAATNNVKLDDWQERFEATEAIR